MGGAAVNSGLCGDCWGGNTGYAENYMDTDDDGICNEGAANGDADTCPDTENNDQWNYDGDDEGDACDADDDNDGALDDDDTEDNNENICSDVDGDTCDDCSVGSSYSPGDDGFDYDGDGLCDAGDDDDDNDGALDDNDTEDNNENI